MKTTLSEARKAGDLEGFIAEREAEAAPPGDEAKLNRVLVSMAQTSKATPGASRRRRSAD